MNVFRCPRCGKETSRLYIMKKHLERITPCVKEAASCDVCGKTFSSRTDLGRHRARKTKCRASGEPPRLVVELPRDVLRFWLDKADLGVIQDREALMEVILRHAVLDESLFARLLERDEDWTVAYCREVFPGMPPGTKKWVLRQLMRHQQPRPSPPQEDPSAGS